MQSVSPYFRPFVGNWIVEEMGSEITERQVETVLSTDRPRALVFVHLCHHIQAKVGDVDFCGCDSNGPVGPLLSCDAGSGSSVQDAGSEVYDGVDLSFRGPKSSLKSTVSFLDAG